MKKIMNNPGSFVEETILDSLTPGVAALREYDGEPDVFARAAERPERAVKRHVR